MQWSGRLRRPKMRWCWCYSCPRSPPTWWANIRASNEYDCLQFSKLRFSTLLLLSVLPEDRPVARRTKNSGLLTHRATGAVFLPFSAFFCNDFPQHICICFNGISPIVSVVGGRHPSPRLVVGSHQVLFGRASVSGGGGVRSFKRPLP